jgi:hypothetical protein
MATFAETMVSKYETLLAENAGLTEVDVDGQKVAYAVLEDKWQFWKGQVAKEKGRKATVSRIRLDRF